MVWWRNKRRPLKKNLWQGIGIGSSSGRNQEWCGKKIHTWPVWTSQSQKWKAHDFRNGSDHFIRKMMSWKIEGTMQSSFWLVQIGHLLFFLPFPLIGCPVEESLLLSTGLLFSRSTLDLLERGCSENVLGKFFLPFQSNAAGGNLKILRKVLKGKNNLINIFFSFRSNHS